MVSHTSIADLLDMTILRFYEVTEAIHSVLEMRKQK